MKEQKSKSNVVKGSKDGNTYKMVMIAFLSALSYVLMLVHFPIKFIGFLELELSDVPAVLAGIAYGPICGIIVEFIKNLIKAITATSTACVGELANFLINSAYVVPAVILIRKLGGKYRFIIAFSVATLCLMVTGALANYFIMVPLYAKAFGGMEVVVSVSSKMVPSIKDLATIVLFGITPFNMVKGIIISLVSYFVYKRIGSHIS